MEKNPSSDRSILDEETPTSKEAIDAP